ncbi:MAG TPA: ABC transporter permease [Bryobacteraceae bacterium]|jgi:predicted permease|nr:ABC transporter permease [Bryobacteraceae bacterium]
MNLIQDITFALRTFSKAPLFVAVAVLSIAFGVGANTAIFSLTDQLLVRTLPVEHPEQLILFSAVGRHYGSNMGWNRISYPMYQDFRDHNSVFSGMFCIHETDFSLNYHGRTERISGELVSGNYFPVLGVKAAAGRLFTASDDKFQKSHPVAVLSYGFWRSRFAGDYRVIGQKLYLNGNPFTVIGVSPPDFAGTDPGYAPEVRIPMMMAPLIADYLDLNERRSRWITAFGRLKPGISVEYAKASIQPFFHQILRMEVQQKAFSKASPYMKQQFLRMSMDLTPAAKGRSNLRRQFEKPLLVLMTTVGLVLLIAAANVANLLIARATGRRKEIAIRLALGSSRRRIMSQLLVESLMLSLAGGIAGLALAFWTDRILLGFLPASYVPITLSAMPDWRILLFNFALSVITGIAFGLIPARQSMQTDLAPTLKDEAGAVVGGTSTLIRKMLVVAQVSLSLLLLIGAGLFIRSLQKLKDLDPGFRTSNLLAFKVNPTLNGYKPERTKQIYERLKESLETLPGIDHAALAVMAVIEGDEWDQWVTIDSYKPKTGELPDPHMNFISPDYFKTMEIPLLTGRDFRKTDVVSSPNVCIVNETFAKKYFGTVNAEGHMIGMGIDPGTKTDIMVVGVSRDTKYESIRDEIPPEVFRPYQQMDFATGIVAYVRTAHNPDDTFSSIRRRVHDIDPNTPIFDMITLEKAVEDSLVTERLIASLSTSFGFLATALAAVGLYGVMAFTVARRTREIGIRMAIGAEKRDVLWMILREVLLLLGIGMAIALPSALVLTKYVQSQLYGIQPVDPASIIAAVVVISAVALLAGYVPARRAARIDPMRALRYE